VSVPYIATSEERVLHQRLSDLTLRVARPLVRYNDRQPWPKSLSGGSCFILRFDRGLIGVTADHVISAFEDDKRKDVGTRCLLRTVPFDLLGAVLARNADLDIATFAVTEDDLTGSEAVALDCRSTSWPPPTPNQGDPVSFCGFPGEIAKLTLHSNVEFHAFMTLAFIQDVTQRDIIVTYEPTRDSRVVVGGGLSELGANLSGCSGGPVLVHYERNGLHRWFPVGMMVAGPREQGTGISAEFDILRLRRIHFIQPDGTIDHPDTACAAEGNMVSVSLRHLT
jgi:hypothetical protein